MLSLPIINRYRAHLSKTFLYDDIIDEFRPYMDAYGHPIDSPIDYLNWTINKVSVPGLSAYHTKDQILKKGNDKVSFKSPINYKNNLTKEIRLTFSMRSAYINWAIMYRQMEKHLSDPDRSFLDPIMVDVMDVNDIVIFQLSFKEIYMKSLSDIDFTVSDDLSRSTFDVMFSFNYYDLDFKLRNTYHPDSRGESRKIY